MERGRNLGFRGSVIGSHGCDGPISTSPSASAPSLCNGHVIRVNASDFPECAHLAKTDAVKPGPAGSNRRKASVAWSKTWPSEPATPTHHPSAPSAPIPSPAA